MLEVGIIGKPSSGKSSFFKAATLIDVKISPVPFTTIKPNRGTSHVIIDCVCKEMGTQCKPKYGMCKNGKRFIPILLWDVAGLVPGAHEGRGLGNQFLDDIRQASALIHIVDASGLTDEEGRMTRGHDPEKDIEFLEKEIDLWFASVIKKAVMKFERQIGKMNRSDLVQILSEKLSGLEIKKEFIEETLNKVPITEEERFATELRKKAKPIIIAANKIDLKEAQENFDKMRKDSFVIPTSAEAEIALKKAAEKNLIEYLPGQNFSIVDETKLGSQQLQALEIIRKEVIDKWGSTGVQTCLNKAVFELLNQIAVYPVADAGKLTDKDGNVLPDVFLVPKGTTVKELAFKVHTTLGEKFIAGIDARTKRRLAADHVLNHRDVVEIVFAK